MIKTYHHNKPFRLESGEELPCLDIAYTTYGNPENDVVWVCHALTADSRVDDWWPGTVVPGRFLDPEKKFVVCANVIGSCYGSTGPMSINPSTGKPYFRSFPRYTLRDVVNAHILLAEALGIGDIKALVGSSVGGFQALEWAVMQPDRFERLVLIATDAKASPWTIAIDETQRMAIESDKTYFDDTPEGGRNGLAAARAIGLLTYRGGEGYNITQADAPMATPFDPHRACSYQRYQGKKLVDRFDAYSYMAILNSFDTHDLGRGRDGGLAGALASIKARTMVVGITSDIIFTPAEMRRLAAGIPGAEYREIDSRFAHDGFLVEADALNDILMPFLTFD